MKIEISVPDPVLEAAERLAKELGMSLSDFCVAALTAYMATCQNGDVTKRLDEVYATEESMLERGLMAIQIASIGDREW
ncbi:MAG: ChpI protein [Phycisphaerales bacterium]|jgi:hypothetical protein